MIAAFSMVVSEIIWLDSLMNDDLVIDLTHGCKQERRRYQNSAYSTAYHNVVEHFKLADLSCFAHGTFGIDSGVCRGYFVRLDTLDHEQ